MSSSTYLLWLSLAGTMATLPLVARAQEAPAKAIVAVVGDAERFNIGQDGYCGKRTEIPRPSNVQFRVPADKLTYFFLKTSFRVPSGTYYCEGDYSFMPEPSKLHVIRFSMQDNS